MNKTVVTVAVLAAVLLGGYFFFNASLQPAAPAPSSVLPSIPQPSIQQAVPEPSPAPPSRQAPPPTDNNVVIYTDSGYSPNALTVKAGETVTFKNRSSRAMWTASAFHPTHRAYPTTGGCLGSTFDACKGIQPGNDWSFKFDVPGTWKYHDHLSPRDFGTIVVE